MFRKKSTTFQHIDAPGYKRNFVDAKQEHTLVDVRTSMEFNQGHLPGVINIPLDQFSQRISEISVDTPVIIVCASGNRSLAASAALVEAGYAQVYNFQGGTMAWMMQGNPIER